MDKHQNEDKSIVPSDKYGSEDFEVAPIPLAPDGGPVPGFGTEQLPAQMSFSQSICARGPCRHYWHFITEFPAGNPESTWAALGITKPRQHNHVCLVHPGVETELNEEFVSECSRWDPMGPSEIELVKLRRRRYYDAHPEAAIEELEEGETDGTDSTES